MHLRTLARVRSEVQVEPAEPTLAAVLDALEACYPALQGTLRDHGTLRRRPFIRVFACQRDLTHEPVDAPLPETVQRGTEPLLIVGAMAGG